MELDNVNQVLKVVIEHTANKQLEDKIKIYEKIICKMFDVISDMHYRAPVERMNDFRFICNSCSLNIYNKCLICEMPTCRTCFLGEKETNCCDNECFLGIFVVCDKSECIEIFKKLRLLYCCDLHEKILDRL